MRPGAQKGFTLIELVVAMAILGTMMLLLYSGISFALRSWDAGDAVGRTSADRRIGEAFVRRELSELFPMRWKDGVKLRFAFEGGDQSLRFVSGRAPGIQMGGLSLVGLEVAGEARSGERSLVMRRAMPDDNADSFTPLDEAKPTVVIAGVDAVEFSYFGAENDFADPKWLPDWPYPARMPQMLRLRVKKLDGTLLPEMVVRVMLGEEAGCLENSFQRLCRPRRAL